MNNRILQQLQKLQIPNKPYFDKNTTELFFPRYVDEEAELTLCVGGIYIITVAPYIIYPPPNFTLTENWNNNIPITDSYLYIEVTGIVGKMIRFTGRGYDVSRQEVNSNFYDNLWLPSKSITILERVN